VCETHLAEPEYQAQDAAAGPASGQQNMKKVPPLTIQQVRAIGAVATHAIEGEMRGDAALSRDVLDAEFPDSGFPGPANVLIMPSVDAANISYNLLRRAAGHGLTVGGILLGAANPAHILTPSSTVRRIVNMTALAVVDANSREAASRS
jgi:phosphotransacetylase